MKALGTRTGRIIVIALLLGLVACLARGEDTAVGFIKSVNGFVTITHRELTYAAALGGPVHEGDTLRTYIGSGVGVTFKDNTRLALGPSSRLTITRFVFTPAENQYGFDLRLIAGTMQYLSGLISKLSPTSVKIETDTTTFGVRGTRFLARTEP